MANLCRETSRPGGRIEVTKTHEHGVGKREFVLRDMSVAVAPTLVY